LSDDAGEELDVESIWASRGRRGFGGRVLVRLSLDWFMVNGRRGLWRKVIGSAGFWGLYRCCLAERSLLRWFPGLVIITGLESVRVTGLQARTKTRKRRVENGWI